MGGLPFIHLVQAWAMINEQKVELTPAMQEAKSHLEDHVIRSIMSLRELAPKES